MSGTLAGRYELIIVDLDGVILLGDEAVPGAAEAIQATVDGGTLVVFVTNNASRRAAEIAALLRSVGVPADEARVLTSARAAAQLLASDLPPAAPVLVVGAVALAGEVAAAGLTPVVSADDRPAAVVQGYGPRVSWPELAEACLAIRAGARWVATNADATLPSPRGPLPGNGSLIAAVSTALGGRRPDLVVGKPSPALFRAAAGQRQARQVLVVGDRLDTDIEAAQRAGMDSLLVLTGVAGARDLLGAGPSQRPTFVAADCRALSNADDQVRVPAWPASSLAVQVGGWRVGHADDRLTVEGTGAGPHASTDALRALTAAAWARPGWRAVVPKGEPARHVLRALGLASPARPDAPGASGEHDRSPSGQLSQLE